MSPRENGAEPIPKNTFGPAQTKQRVSSIANSRPQSPEVSRLVERLFRHEAGKMVAVLTGIFGIQHLGLAEDVVQEALARALQRWPYYGVPKNPAAWLTQTAKNLAVDTIRREWVFREKEPEILATLEQWPASGLASEAPRLDAEIKDDRLRMMFVCCHPLIPAEAQAALALNTLCGFSVTEISSAFLTTQAAVAKRLTRAKQKIREAQIPFAVPAGPELARRLDGVLQALYLLFNEGYKASAGDFLVRADVCQEAIRLASLLAEHPAGNQPTTHALLALMLLNAARFTARVDDGGNLIRLQEQERARWDQALIARGMFHFAQSAAGGELTGYHLEAGIAACHCAAGDYAATDWGRILELYDRLMELDDSPVVALNRAVAVAAIHGPRAGIEAVGEIPDAQSLESYHLFYAVLAEFEAGLKNFEAASGHLRKAIELASVKSEQSFLTRRLNDCEARA